jgi:isopenicillin N synthase-like dioxygenase
VTSLPIIDMSPLFDPGKAAENRRVATAIRDACRNSGFFYVTGHGVDPNALTALDSASRRFFEDPEHEKMKLAMQYGGVAWRGYFPVGGELTSGQADQKEGLYFGTELPSDHPRVLARTPLHGSNLWPESVPELRDLVLDYMEATASAAQVLLQGIALSLDLDRNYFSTTYTANPTVLFRIFHYPSVNGNAWGVGEHTDYGLLTLLAQDHHGGLQVKSNDTWIDAPPIENALVCNLGDMLDRLTGGWYRSTPHRVLNSSGRGRLSFPLFFDPDFDADLRPLPSLARCGTDSAAEQRWDNADLQAFEGTYGDYLMEKVSKVFPDLAQRSGVDSELTRISS